MNFERHSFATHMLMRRVNIREVQEYLGHNSVETTMTYTHVMRGLASTAVSRWIFLPRPVDAARPGAQKKQRTYSMLSIASKNPSDGTDW